MIVAMLMLTGPWGAGGSAVADTKAAADATQAEMPKAPGEGQMPPGASELEAEMKKPDDSAEAAPPPGHELKPGRKHETKDWADEERWGRYGGGGGAAEEPKAEEGSAPGPRRVRRAPPAGSGWPPILRRRPPGAALAVGLLALVLLVLLPTAAYVLAIQFLGIYVASTFFIGAFMRAMDKSSWVKTLLVSLGVNLLLFWMFEIQFKVPLPKGPLEALFGY